MTRYQSIQVKRIGGSLSEERTPSFTDNQTLDNPAYTQALSELNKERARLAIRTPCEYDPAKWDPIAGERATEEELIRIEDAKAQCTYCPALSQCEDLALVVLTSETPPTTGVLAGCWIQ